MNASLMPAQEDDTPVEAPDSPGGRLCAARQARGLSQDQVAAELRLSPSVIEALERNDYEVLAGRVFVTGYIRKYARLVGLDPEPLLDAYGMVTTQEAPGKRPATPPSDDGRRRGDGYLVLGLVGAGILVLLGILAFLWRQDPGDPEPEAPSVAEMQEAAPLVAPSGSDPSGLPESESQGMQSQPGMTLLQPPEVTGGAGARETDGVAGQALPTTDARSAAAATEPGTEEPAVAADLEVVMAFEGSCWVQVYNQEEKTPEVYGELKQGEQRVLRGKPPYRITLGNATVARVMVGGKAIDLSKYTKGGSVARFTLDPNRTPMDLPR